MNIDGKNIILGRLASIAAKKALEGEEVNILNCRDVVVTGRKAKTLERYENFRNKGTHSTGPFMHRVPYKMVKKTIRGMLPSSKTRGREALKRVKCYNGVPEEFKDVQLEKPEKPNVNNSLVSKYITMKEICTSMGGKDV